MTTPAPPPLDKAKVRMQLFRAEVKYLLANDWISYIPGIQDSETGEWKAWADKDTPKLLITHDEAVTIQKLRDLEKDKENADNG